MDSEASPLARNSQALSAWGPSSYLGKQYKGFNKLKSRKSTGDVIRLKLAAKPLVPGKAKAAAGRFKFLVVVAVGSAASAFGTSASAFLAAFFFAATFFFAAAFCLTIGFTLALALPFAFGDAVEGEDLRADLRSGCCTCTSRKPY